MTLQFSPKDVLCLIHIPIPIPVAGVPIHNHRRTTETRVRHVRCLRRWQLHCVVANAVPFRPNLENPVPEGTGGDGEEEGGGDAYAYADC